MSIKLTAQNRDRSQKLDVLRAEGLLPAVVYGATTANTSLSINHADFIKLYKTAGETTLLNLETPGGMINVLIHDVQIDARTHKALHVDFIAVDMKSAVTVNVPINYIGEAPAVRAGLGVLNTLVDELEIEVMPNEIPQSLDVDISGLENLHDSLYVSNVRLPKSAEPIQPMDTVICTIGDFQKEVETSADEIDLESVIEVDSGKGKKEEGEE